MSLFKPEIPPASFGLSKAPLAALFKSPESSSGGANALKQALAEYLPEANRSQILLFSSAKEALFRLLGLVSRGQRKRYVLLAAYTCPDLAKAIVKAGLKLALCEHRSGSLSMDETAAPVDLGQDVLAVVVSNLYGFPEKLEVWRKLSLEHGFLLIDDSCQSLFSADASGPCGFRPNTVGLLSFGRGKSISGLGGGALIVSDSSPLDPAVCSELLSIATPPSAGWQDLLSLLKCWGLLAGRNNLLYTIARKLKVFGLGETDARLDFKLSKLSRVQLNAALIILQEIKATLEVRRAVLEQWLEQLSPLSLEFPFLFGFPFPITSPGADNLAAIRLPLLVPTGEKSKVLNELRQWGVSGSYPFCLADYPELEHFVTYREVSKSRELASRLVTLPLHQGLSQQHILQATACLRDTASLREITTKQV